MVQLIQIFR